jgi:hypothetical protein
MGPHSDKLIVDIKAVTIIQISISTLTPKYLAESVNIKMDNAIFINRNPNKYTDVVFILLFI